MRISSFIAQFFFIACVVVSCDTKNSVEPLYKQYFIKYYGEDGDQEGADFVVNSDETVIILGTSTFGQSKRIYLVKVDPEGNEIWKKTFGSLTNEIGMDIEPITAGPDAGNFVVMSNVSRGVDAFDIRLTIINTNGDSLKSTLFNQLASQTGKTVTPISDGGYFIAGKTTDTNPNDAANANLPPPNIDTEDLLVIRLKDDFTYIQSDVNRIGGSYEGSAVKIFQEGSLFYFAGYADELRKDNPADNAYEHNILFRKFIDNPSGVATLYSGSDSQHEIINAIAKSPSGAFMAVGFQRDPGGNKLLYVASVTNNFGAVPYQGAITDTGNQHEGIAVAPSGESKFLVLTNEFNAVLNRDIYLRKMNITFNKEFEVRFGSPNNDDTASAVTELPNGDILVLGTMHLTNQKKIALIKLNSAGKFE